MNYGVLKALSEIATLETGEKRLVGQDRGRGGTHRAWPVLPRGQDAGVGYFFASLADALE